MASPTPEDKTPSNTTFTTTRVYIAMASTFLFGLATGLFLPWSFKAGGVILILAWIVFAIQFGF